MKSEKNEFQGNNEQYGWCRLECEITDDNICRLTVNYSLEQTQKILEAAEKGQFPFVFGKVHYPNGKDLFVSLTPPEVTAVRNNSPDETNVIIGFFYCNVMELWVRKIDADMFLKILKQEQGKIGGRKRATKRELIDEIYRLADEAVMERQSKKESTSKRQLSHAIATKLASNEYYYSNRGASYTDRGIAPFLTNWKPNIPKKMD